MKSGYQSGFPRNFSQDQKILVYELKLKDNQICLAYAEIKELNSRWVNAETHLPINPRLISGWRYPDKKLVLVWDKIKSRLVLKEDLTI